MKLIGKHLIRWTHDYLSNNINFNLMKRMTLNQFNT